MRGSRFAVDGWGRTWHHTWGVPSSSPPTMRHPMPPDLCCHLITDQPWWREAQATNWKSVLCGKLGEKAAAVEGPLNKRTSARKSQRVMVHPWVWSPSPISLAGWCKLSFAHHHIPLAMLPKSAISLCLGWPPIIPKASRQNTSVLMDLVMKLWTATSI